MKQERSSSTDTIPRDADGGAKRGSDKVRAINAVAVKKIRAGDFQGALNLLRKIVYPGDGGFWNDEAPACAQVNFAVALYLDYRWEASLKLVHEFVGEDLETRETRMIREWYDQLSRWQRVQLWLGMRIPLADLGPDAGVLN